MKQHGHVHHQCVGLHSPRSGLVQQAALTLWESEIVQAGHPDMLFVGHTHTPMMTQFQRTLVINPGSVGQPRDGDPRAAYVLWQDTAVSLCRVKYDVEHSARAFAKLTLAEAIKQRLLEELRSGGQPVSAVAGGR